jgi:hypothetical protein
MRRKRIKLVTDVEGGGRRARRGIKGNRDEMEILGGAPSLARNLSPAWTVVRSSGERGSGPRQHNNTGLLLPERQHLEHLSRPPAFPGVPAVLRSGAVRAIPFGISPRQGFL